MILDNADVLYSEDGDEYRPALRTKTLLYLSHKSLSTFITLLFTASYMDMHVYLKLKYRFAPLVVFFKHYSCLNTFLVSV